MISTVGDIRKAIDGLSDEMPVDLDIKMGHLYTDDIVELNVVRHKGVSVIAYLVVEAYDRRMNDCD